MEAEGTAGLARGYLWGNRMRSLPRHPLARSTGAILSLALLLASCELGGSSDQGNAQGGSSDQGNAIQVRLVDRFGAPVANASLEILPEAWMSPRAPDASLPYASRAVTDSLGEARLRLPTGVYAIQGRFEHLASIVQVRLSSDRRLELVLRAASDVVGTLSTPGVDTLYVPGTRLFSEVGPDGTFRIDSLPKGSNTLSTRDGRVLQLDTSGSGFVREYRSSVSVGNAILPLPDTLIPKYYGTRRSPLPLETTRPTGVLESWVPDSVWASGDTVWISSLVRSCDALPEDGLAGWWHAESLEVFKRRCPVPSGEPVLHLFHKSPRAGIWTVGTLQPFGYTWEMP